MGFFGGLFFSRVSAKIIFWCFFGVFWCFLVFWGGVFVLLVFLFVFRALARNCYWVYFSR